MSVLAHVGDGLSRARSRGEKMVSTPRGVFQQNRPGAATRAFRVVAQNRPFAGVVDDALRASCDSKPLRMNSSAPSETQSRPLSKAGSVLRCGAETAQIDR